MKTDEVRNFIYEWNIYSPVDRWWRKKHNIAFGSPKHRAMTFIDQYIEYMEEKLFTEPVREKGKDWIKAKVFTEEELDKQFDEMDLDQFDEI